MNTQYPGNSQRLLKCGHVQCGRVTTVHVLRLGPGSTKWSTGRTAIYTVDRAEPTARIALLFPSVLLGYDGCRTRDHHEIQEHSLV